MVIDASAVVALLFGEPAADAIERCFLGADAIFASAATVLECSIVITRRFGPPGDAKLDELIAQLGITVVPFDDEQLALARAAYRRFGRGRHPAQLNFGDCFSYALAKKLGEPLLFVGDDLSQTDITGVLSG